MDHVEVAESQHGWWLFHQPSPMIFPVPANSPGWQRAQQRHYAPHATDYQCPRRDGCLTMNDSAYKRGERIFHQKFGYGRIEAIEGNKLTCL